MLTRRLELSVHQSAQPTSRLVAAEVARKRLLQFLMSEMNTARPRIPSPFDTAGMVLGARSSLSRTGSKWGNYPAKSRTRRSPAPAACVGARAWVRVSARDRNQTAGWSRVRHRRGRTHMGRGGVFLPPSSSGRNK